MIKFYREKKKLQEDENVKKFFISNKTNSDKKNKD